MKLNSAKVIIGSIIALLTLVAVCIVNVRAQQVPKPSNRSPLTTNWLGYLVVGRLETFDRISPHPSPTVERQVEIGLRSDGVVIWRETSR